MFYFFFFFLCSHLLLAEIADWEKAQLQKELSSIEISYFHPAKIIQTYKKIQSRINKTADDLSSKISYVRISKNQTIFINEQPINRLNHRLARLMKKLKKFAPLPSCSFFFVRNGAAIKRYKELYKTPILVGSKLSGQLTNQILFIENCSTVDNGEKRQDWNSTFAYEQTIQNRNLYEWEEKIPCLIWRGCLSDKRHLFLTPISDSLSVYLSPRTRIHLLSQRYPELIDAKITNVSSKSIKYLESIGVTDLFSLENGKPSDLYNTTSMEINPRVSIKDHLKYRYQIALDGVHATNPGYAWRLLSGCLVFKQESPYSQWFYAGLIPYVHFIPVKRNLDDLIEKIKKAIKEDAQSKQIGINGQKFAEKELSLDRFFEHAHYVLKEYAKLQKKSRRMNR